MPNFKETSFTDWINNKTNYRQIIKELDFPIIPGFSVKNLEEAKKYFRSLKNQGFKEIVLKKERSVAGFGVFIVKTEKEMEKRLEKEFSNQKQFLLEGFIKGIRITPNVQYWVGPKKINFINVSDQLLEKDQISYAGNVFPSNLRQMSNIWEDIENLSLKFCNYLQEQRCYGLVGIDWIVNKDSNIYTTEANVRLNASTFVHFIINQLFSSPDKVFWKTFTLGGQPVSFEKLFKSSPEIFINQEGGFGIFPLDIGIMNSLGNGQFISTGKNPEMVDIYINKLRRAYENLSGRKMQ